MSRAKLIPPPPLAEIGGLMLPAHAPNQKEGAREKKKKTAKLNQFNTEGPNMLDPDVSAAGRLTTTQIQILAENQRKRIALSKAKAELFRVAREHHILRENHQRDLDEQYEALEYLHWDNQKKAEKIDDLQKQLQLKEEQLARKVKDVEDGFQEHEQQLKRNFLRREQDLQSHVRSLQDTIAELETFKQDKERLETEISRLKVDHEALKQDKMSQGMKLERKYIKQNLKMRDDFQAKLDRTVAEMEADLDRRLPARIQGILAQNQQLSSENADLRRAVESLRERALEAEARLAAVEASGTMAREMAVQERERMATQGRALREAEERLRAMAERVKELGAEAEALRGARRDEAQRVERTLAEELKRARERAEVAEADAKKVRAVAAEVLQQRTDVEAFLVSALEEVRREMQREARQRTGGGAGPRTQVSGSGAGLRGWSAGGSSAGAGLMEGGGGDGQVDISQLSWPERERVLRALFVRINAADRKVTARQLPAGDLGSEQGRKGKGGGETLQGMG